ncbi:DUF3050 domain-containing protein [Spirosoma aerolatum]|uniref:DUF3050 domain-containing protein n=1 Tax=Spirosoma aerolatum TaxID=1211326 RepID=UPI0009ADB327|nr:DUF3050 domain-containing protein [Spirosoma aerolatum]
MQPIDRLKAVIEPFRQEIINHKVYSAIKTIDDLTVFMQYHVYAVWDFMSLLKTLQNNLTCTSVPWFPRGSADTRYLINEIVAGEESDIDLLGERKSHFEMYLDAMQQAGADSSQIMRFLSTLQENGSLEKALLNSETPTAASDFVRYTFDVIHSQKPHLQSAVFTFGREDLIPGMFLSMIQDLNTNFPGNISQFTYYLERHIEVDGDHHSHLALQMTANLCGDNQTFWQEAEQATIASLQQRIRLWDGVYETLLTNQSVAQPVPADLG